MNLFKKKNSVEVVNASYGKAVYVGSDIELPIKYALENNIKGVIVSFDHGYRLQDVNFLSTHSWIEYLTIQYYGKIDLNGIHHLGNLRGLYLNITDNDTQLIDFSCFPYLETSYFDWRPKAKSIFDCKTLKELRIDKFRKPDLQNLSGLCNLKLLRIGSSPIISLSGIEKLNLSRLDLVYLTKLESLRGIEGLSDTLVSLELNTCKKISSINEIGLLNRLKYLGVNNCGDIESIKGIRGLQLLERFDFWESTNVLDGDISPLLQLKKLKKIAFMDRPHYTHTNDGVYENIYK